jgi:hypothetical protein
MDSAIGLKGAAGAKAIAGKEGSRRGIESLPKRRTLAGASIPRAKKRRNAALFLLFEALAAIGAWWSG